MIVIDVHVHAIEKLEQWMPWTHELFRKFNPQLYEDFQAHMCTEGMLRMLDEAEVSYAVVLAEECPGVSGYTSNEFVARLCGESSGRLIPFASFNPNKVEDPAAKLEELVTELGMRGLKLLPSYNHFYPNDPKLYPMYERAVELGIPVMFHTGSSIFKGTKLKYADPIHLDDLAVDFPDLIIIQAHGGRGFWYDEAVFLARIHQNVFIDISGLPPQNLLKYFPDLERFCDKFLFGSDWPAAIISKNIKELLKLPISKEAKEKILGKNALKVLNINA